MQLPAYFRVLRYGARIPEGVGGETELWSAFTLGYAQIRIAVCCHCHTDVIQQCDTGDPGPGCAFLSCSVCATFMCHGYDIIRYDCEYSCDPLGSLRPQKKIRYASRRFYPSQPRELCAPAAVSVLTSLRASVEPDDGRRGAGSGTTELSEEKREESSNSTERSARPLQKKLVLSFARKTAPARSRTTPSARRR